MCQFHPILSTLIHLISTFIYLIIFHRFYLIKLQFTYIFHLILTMSIQFHFNPFSSMSSRMNRGFAEDEMTVNPKRYDKK